jgi:hypothetical protein
MRKNKFIIITLSIFFALLFNTCKKYEEGGFHLWAKHNLLSHNGKWSLEKYEVNGIDSTDFVISNNDPEIKKNFLIIFYSSHEYYMQIDGLNINDFLLSSNKAEMIIGNITGFNRGGGVDSSFINNIKIRRIFTPEFKSATWKVLELKKSKLILTNISANSYKIILKPNT